MGLTVRHTFESAKADSSDATLIQPSHWNAAHSVEDSSLVLISTDYDFGPIQPGGSLTAGITNTVTLPSVPKGMNGTNTNHYIYIYDGTGTAEAVLITGGTAVSEGSNQTITFVPANNHSGSWKIKSATAGIQEAKSDLPANGGIVFIPAGTYSTYYSIIIDAWYVVIKGAGIGNTVISPSAGTYDVFKFLTGSQDSIRELTIRTSLGRSGGYAISTTSQVGFYASNISIDSMPNGVHITSGNQNLLENIYIGEHTGNGVLVDGANGFVLRMNRILIGSSQNATAGIRFKETGDTILSDSHILLCQHGILIDPDNGQTVASLELNSVYADTSITDAIRIAPATGGMVYRARFNSVWASGTTAGEGLVITTSAGGTVSGVQIVNAQVYGNSKTGIYIDGASGGGITNVSISNSHIGANSYTSAGSYNGVLINASNWQFINNVVGVIDGFSSNTQNIGLQVYSAANNYYIIQGNDFHGNVTAGLDDEGTGVDKIVKDNLGVDDTTPGTIASATTINLAYTGHPVTYISGTTTITTINRGWKGRKVTLIKTDAGSVTVGGGGNIPGSHTIAQYASLTLTYDGSNWY